MTEDYKQMKNLVEKAGRCWHERKSTYPHITHTNEWSTYCPKCGKDKPVNPSPHSVDDLSEIEAELGLKWFLHRRLGNENGYASWIKGFDVVTANTPADALRLAMCRATGWKEEV